ncbi:hypothetical protein FJZ33_00085 [Candidatus Poribacteria bacterium]|nr:hypothetical protein [Candidatus Poribacteria bacterium]
MDKEAIIKELKETISEAGLKVGDIFSPEDITNSEPARKAKQTEFEHAKRVEKVLGEEREKVISLTRSIEEKENKIKSLNEVVSKTQVKTLFDTAKETRKLDDKEKVYIEKRLGTFKSDKDGDDLKNEFEKFLDSQVNDYIETAKLLGVDIKKGDGGDDKGDKGKGAGSGDGKGDGEDLTKPENNEFIPK